MSKQKKLEGILNFTSQLEVMVLSGLSFSEAMEILEETTTCPVFHHKLKGMNESLKEGISIKNSLNPDLFPSFYLHTIGIGEASGNLDHSLSVLRTFYEKELNWLKKRHAIMVYPKILLWCSFFLLILTSQWILPNFQSQQDLQFDHNPWYIRIPIFINDYIFILFLIGVLVFGLGHFLKKHRRIRRHYQEVKSTLAMTLPVIKTLSIAKMQLAFSENLKTLIQCGATIPEAIAFIGKDTEQTIFAKSLHNLEDSLHKGDSLHASMKKNHRLFSPFMTHLIRAGEESGDLTKVLERMIHFLEEKHVQSITKFYKVLEPLIILVMAVYIGLIMLSILMPMLDTFDAILP